MTSPYKHLNLKRRLLIFFIFIFYCIFFLARHLQEIKTILMTSEFVANKDDEEKLYFDNDINNLRRLHPWFWLFCCLSFFFSILESYFHHQIIKIIRLYKHHSKYQHYLPSVWSDGGCGEKALTPLWLVVDDHTLP